MKKINLVLMSIGLMLFIVSENVVAKNSVRKTAVKNATRLANNNTRVKKSGPLSKASLADLTKNIEYNFAKADVRKIYYDKLDQLAQAAIDNKYALSLRGYADSIGSYKGNWVISDIRAKTVKNYLVSKGVDADKIITTPFGSTKPIASNKTKQGRQKNRRVEIKINEVNN